ncbi:MAG TPA: squalene/phytoene synthase family protein [Thermoanaerobaculia bacterium]|nr:squalene/phytoene synthase family protein [Thermoanaerobaculia bacterium]
MRDIDQLLERTSRTFALSIPLLPEPTRQEVTLAYLLFRIADTLEDAASWPRERRRAALDELVELLELPVEEVAPRAEEASRRWCAGLPSEHQGYLDLLAATPYVFERFAALAPAARRIIARDTLRTARGMAEFVARSDAGGRLELRDEDDLRRYCFVVAGIVGEMLTDLFLLDRPALTAADGDELRRRAATFGEALQLVNILKDSRADAAEGRRYLPRGVDRAAVFALARRDLAAAAEYVLVLQAAEARGLERGIVAFCALPVRLAAATLDRVETEGAGAKLTRPEVFAIAADLERALERGEPAATEPGPPGAGLAPAARDGVSP